MFGDEHPTESKAEAEAGLWTWWRRTGADPQTTWNSLLLLLGLTVGGTIGMVVGLLLAWAF